MRRFLLATALSLVTAHFLIAEPARADYAAAEAALQAGNIAAAVPLLAEEARLGNPVAAFNLAKIYEDGAAGAPDFQQAATYYRIAAEIDTAPRYNGAALGAQAPQLISAAQMYGQFALGRLYETGRGVPQDYPEAVGWYTRSADLGNIKAMLKLAIVLREGLPGINPDPAASASWLQRAAEAGSIPAALELGRAYQSGMGVVPNAQEAAKWFGIAAAGGSVSAEFHLGQLYRQGLGGQPDFVRAVEHFERGANAKDAQSMLALGDLYASGQGVPLDKAQAYAWYSLAADQGATDGSARAAALAQTMNPQEIASGTALHDNWQPKAKEEQALPAASAEPTPVTPAPVAPAPVAPAPVMPAPIAQPATPAAASPAPDLPPLFEESAPAQPAATVDQVPTQPMETLPNATEATDAQGMPVLMVPGLEQAAPAATAPSVTAPDATAPAQQPNPAPLPKSTPSTAPLDPTAPLIPGTPQPGAKPFDPTAQ